MNPRILIITTSAATMGTSDDPTGLWLDIARQSGWDARVNLDEILRRGRYDGISLIVAGKSVVAV